MTDATRVSVSIELDCSSDPPTGVLIGSDGKARRFESLLGLLNAIEAATNETSAVQTNDNSREGGEAP